ncbi:transglycosylase domain-containing protein [Paenibacillus sp. tmac-D7]|uniref:transglycosylase domain-containing protein n=1 Tax=Paenibacillus sp. tmac-D7 TaxID=2591462 RepID=UPI00114129F0|nr:PBP1A family penicillin-binding protein [Paenibacillus sp. tmac-D7]
MTGSSKKTPNQAPKERKTSSGLKKKKKKVTTGKVFLAMFIAGALAAICAMGVYIFVILNGNKILQENLDKLEFDEASHILDINGAEVGVLKVENRENIDPKEVPELLRQAFVATEDKRFDEHAGVDLFGIARALVKDVVARSMVEGGSTITQQLAKNVFLSADKTFFRKATEMSIAMALEQNKTKDEILTYYLNRIYFGNRAYGVKTASKIYFGKSDLSKLELWEVATLAAMPKAPNTYNPISNPDKSKERRAVVLKLMYDQGYITEAQRAEAAAHDYERPAGAAKDQFQSYIDYVLREAQEKYNFEEDDLLRGGYKIYTNLDPNAQAIMEQTYANPKFFQKDGPAQKMQSSMVILNNKDGGIVAMIGGRDYVVRGLNRAVAQPRQPGSAFKPLISYAPALELGKFSPYSKLPDEQKSYNGYSPRNWDGVYRGQVTMFEAIKKSVNIPAVEVLNQVGISKAKSYVEKLGIPFDKADNNLAIALGGLTKGVTTLQMAQAYTSFPNNGNVVEAHAIIKIMDDSGERAAFKAEKKAPVWSAKTAWYMTQLLQGVLEPGGTGTAAKFERPVAGKTGSTQLELKGLEKYNRDLWFVGYTPEWTAAVWMGFDKTDAKHYVSMSSGAPAAIFKEVMQKALAKKPMTKFVKPSGVADMDEPPKGIGDLKAEFVAEKKSVKLTWSAVGEGVVYQVFRKDSKMQEFPSEPITSTTVTEVNDISAIQPDTYEYTVVPLNPENNVAGARSNIASVTVSDSSNPQQPGTENDGEPLDPNAPEAGQPGTGTGHNPGGTNGNGGTGAGSGQQPGTGKPGGTTTPGGSKPGTGTGAGTGTGGTGAGAGSGTPPGTGGAGGTTPGNEPGGGEASNPIGGQPITPDPAVGGNNGGTFGSPALPQRSP